MHDDLMQEVLSEAESFDSNEYAVPETHVTDTQYDAEKAQKERIAKEREAAFEAEVARMDQEQRKAARKQKRKDAAIVRKILRASDKGDLYGVLQLINLEYRIPSRTVKLIKLQCTIPGISLFRVSQRKIKKAYRSLARSVHPDKNKDGRAVEAFQAVENAASILSDEVLRNEYDAKLRHRRSQRLAETNKVAKRVVHSTFRTITKGVGTFKAILGPFAFPVLLLGSLLA